MVYFYKFGAINPLNTNCDLFWGHARTQIILASIQTAHEFPPTTAPSTNPVILKLSSMQRKLKPKMALHSAENISIYFEDVRWGRWLQRKWFSMERLERAPRARSGPLCVHLPRRSAARSVTWPVLSLHAEEGRRRSCVTPSPSISQSINYPLRAYV